MRLLLLISSILVFTSCQNSKPEVSVEDQNQRALTLIEKGQMDEAIEILKVQEASRPNDRSKTLLASAYAKKAGFEIQDYWGYTVGYPELVEEAQVVGKKGLENIFGQQLAPVIYQELEKQGMTGADLNLILKRLAQVPERTAEQIELLIQARDSLSQAESGGARLYRAIIGVVILKYALSRTVEYIPKAALSPKSQCKKAWQTVSNWFLFSLQGLDEVLKDISIGFPSQATQAQEASGKIKQFIEELPQKKKELTGQICPEN